VSPPIGALVKFAITSSRGAAGMRDARTFADWTLRPRLLAVPGVSQVIVHGGEIERIEVRPDPIRMRQLGVTLSDLIVAIRQSQATRGAGFAETANVRADVQDESRLTLADADASLAALPVAKNDESVVRLDQVADVVRAATPPVGAALYDGRDAVYVQVNKLPAADTIEVTRAVEDVIKRSVRSLPAGSRIETPVFRQASFIDTSLRSVGRAMAIGSILVIFVLVAFLRSGRLAIISLTAIPLSIVTAAFVLVSFGASINGLTLGGLAIAVGEVVDDAKRSAMAQVREIEQHAREEGEERARKILTIAIQRVASEQTAESTVSVFALPSEDMKGRIIGREGRNIRAFEATTGVNLIIDDTPEAVVLSSFDPVRREAARMTLEKLVQDGRIHPARIEEIHERSLAEIEERVRRAGDDAVAEVGITDVHPEMIKLLGRLQYRTSYGQNVLRHLVESAHIASSLAAELGVDPKIAKRGAFLHDIGKAVTHEVEGSHAIIGAEIARRMKEDPEVVHCIESHHGEVEQRTVDAVLAQIADSISGGRPGARRESLETYVKRLERLEEICTAFPGVEKVYAMQAGREVRVLVQPEAVDDLTAQVIARDIAKQVEEELQYPGQIRITVVRETRATEYAR
jgi:conserved hypothetical protein YmdA/YtgF